MALNRTIFFDHEGLALLHLKLFHPLDDHSGFPPLGAAGAALDLHNAAANWNKALLDNSARPSGALVYQPKEGGNLSADQYERLKAELEAGYAGAVNAGRPLLLEGGLDWKSMGLSPKDMDFIEAKNGAARDIALAFGVPPMLIGTLPRLPMRGGSPMSAANALLQAIHQRLSDDAALSAAIGPDGIRDRLLPRATLPCIVIGDMETRDFSTSTESGEEHFLTLEIWSDGEGRRLTQQIAGLVRGLLHDAALTTAGVSLVSLLYVGMKSRRELKTKFYVAEMRFRAVTE